MVIRPPPEPTSSVSAEALFRFQVVSQVRAATLAGVLRAHAVTDAAARPHPEPDGRPRRVSKRTVYRWLAAFERDGFAGLEPRSRRSLAASRALPDVLLEFVERERTQDPAASIPELLRRATERGVIESSTSVDRTTVWRAMRRMGLPTRHVRRREDRDARRFALPHRMQMLLCDGKHFRAGPNRVRRVALFFLDDATRYGLHVIVGTSETTELFLRGLYECIGRWGLFDCAYLDNGSGFASLDTRAVFARGLEVALIHGTAGYPEGRGKIERFNRRVKAEVLRGLDRAAGIDTSCRSLTLRLRHYMSHDYNMAPHATLKRSPQAAWDADPRPLRFPESDAALRRGFVVREQRDVSNDNVLRHGGALWEVPRGHARTTVMVHRQVLDGTLRIMHDGRLVRLHPLDTTANAYTRRGRPAPVEPSAHAAPTTAAALRFQRDFGPLVGPDGGFTDTDPHEEE